MLWGEIKNSALANLDLTENEAIQQRLIGNFYLWANEVITQISSSIKPKRSFEYVTVYEPYDRWKELSLKYCVFQDKMPTYDKTATYTEDEEKYWTDWNDTVFVNTVYKMKAEDFIAFGDDIAIVKRTINYHGHIITDECEVHDKDMIYRGYKSVLFFIAGEYSIPYNARWCTFESTISDEDIDDPASEGGNIDGIVDNSEIVSSDGELVPRDILECIPPYIAMKGFKIDDEYKSAVFKNEYEMALARINDEHFEQNRTLDIGGDW